MKKVIIFGASGSLAPYVIEAIEEQADAELSLFVRNKERLQQNFADKYHVIEGDATDFNAVKNAVEGKDIVYVNLAGDLETMAGNIVSAMQASGVKRIIAISSIGIYQKPLRPVLKPYRKLADLIEASVLDYTILRPDWFTSSNEIDYALTSKGQPETGKAVSRKSIAAFIARLVKHPEQHLKENLGISKPD